MDLIYPEIFRDKSTVECLFTTANRNSRDQKEGLDGLNFGINTEEEDQVVSENYNHLFDHLGWKQQKIALARQVHGNRIAGVEQPGIYENCDGLVTTRPDLPLGIQVADCAAVLVADTKNKIIGAFHAGWRGAESNIVENGIDSMIRLNADPKYSFAYISPCISLEKFEVGEEVAALFPDEFTDRVNFRKPHVDLKQILHRQLLNCGLTENNIDVSGECTVSDNRFFSFRRERSAAGRMLGLIKINS